MSFGIVVPLILLPVAIVVAFAWYRRSMAALRPDEAKPVSGLRLTAEALHRAPTPPWRVVYEIGGALGAIDHVVVGPAGVTAITTVVADRPDPELLRSARNDAVLVGEAAIARGPLDELLRAADSSCDQWARVYWGAPDSKRSAAEDLVHGSALVEGQRVDEWLSSLVAHASTSLDADRVDTIWRTIVTGIGRPDPRG
ncbi:MAG TPA: hypothetical protein VMY16_14335 [Ilumatobacteraceae bacterium]|nr:hypothetical protein [Ilumatobacteraceae bacterium]